MSEAPRPAPPPKKADTLKDLEARVRQRTIAAISAHRDAHPERWTKLRYQDAVAFVDSLVKRDGSPPKNIEDEIFRIVRNRFAKICLELNIEKRTLPGQYCDWYGRVFSRVKHREKRKVSKA